VKAQPEEQQRLLHVQDRDTRLTQLDHRSSHLPELQELSDVEVRLGRLAKEVIAAETIVSDLELEQRRVDADVDVVRQRQAKDQDLLDSGSIGDPKQLQNLQHELESLARRQRDLEDVELEIMERVEGAQAAVTVLVSEREELESRKQVLTAAITEQMSVIDAERAEVVAERADLVASLPTDLMALYEKVRGEHGGLGAAPLRRGRCEGCHLQLPPQEIADIASAPIDEVLRCEECRRILVRTAESGLG
jgi:hypothetical protein